MQKSRVLCCPIVIFFVFLLHSVPANQGTQIGTKVSLPSTLKPLLSHSHILIDTRKIKKVSPSSFFLNKLQLEKMSEQKITMAERKETTNRNLKTLQLLPYLDPKIV